MIKLFGAILVLVGVNAQAKMSEAPIPEQISYEFVRQVLPSISAYNKQASELRARQIIVHQNEGNLMLAIPIGPSNGAIFCISNSSSANCIAKTQDSSSSSIIILDGYAWLLWKLMPVHADALGVKKFENLECYVSPYGTANCSVASRKL